MSATLPQRIVAKPSLFDLSSGMLLLITLPPLTIYMWMCVNFFEGALFVPTPDLLSLIPPPTLTALGIYVAWFGLQVLLQIFAPGEVHEGTPLYDGTRLKYKMNGWFSFCVTMGLVVFLTVSGLVPATILHDQFGPLLVTVNLLTFALTAFLYFHGKASKRRERISGNAFYEYFIGNELNPRIGNLDLKLFCEARPGLILWILINMSLAAKQYELHGMLTTPMILVNAFQFLYIADYYYHEEAILTTWDIKHENFGWMLCWGDLVWVPFTYTLQAYYLVHNTHELSWAATIGLIVMNMVGYTIFRGSNWQKHKFRKNPQGLVWGKAPEYIRTKHGSLLLTSGWWGMSRHMNYFGDLIMALAWCLPTGFGSPLPYFYITYFSILLIHREYRDNLMCQEKYRDDWDAYCAKVRWRIVPGVY